MSKTPTTLAKPIPASRAQAAMAFAESKPATKAAEQDGEKLARLNANIKADLHRKLKMKAAAEGVTMGDLIEAWIKSL